uniref:SWR1-complex protein 3 domain-containing protein n=1 Tax=Bionectria ochroleuca TaxID=29856 RepID=A0A8H7NMH9_BIOOC
MERKRKLPPRAAARVESAAKRRQSTPRSETPAPVQPPVEEPAPSQPPPTPPPSLPNSVQAGKPLPTVEDAQSDDLSSKEYQSVGESGVLTESLSRSRQKWTHEGLFEKYWTKPHKRKGVVHEDPKNPPKDSMTKVGVVTITIEPHVVEATMYVVKDPKPRLPQNQQQQQQPLPPNRPIIQYGPPNGTMPSPKPVAATPAPESATAIPAASPANKNPAPISPAPSNSQVQVAAGPTNPAAPPTPTTNNNPAPPPAGPSYPLDRNLRLQLLQELHRQHSQHRLLAKLQHPHTP